MDPRLLPENSTHLEKLLEHAFVAELAQELWVGHGEVLDVARAEVDASGFDLVLECRGVTRHVQLKSMVHKGRARSQPVNHKLTEKPSGCVVLIVHRESPETRRMHLGYFFYGAEAGTPLAMSGLKPAKHTRGNKSVRRNTLKLPKSSFAKMANMTELIERLFGLKPATAEPSST